MVQDRALVPEWELALREAAHRLEVGDTQAPVHRLEAGHTVEARLRSMDYRIVHRKKPREHW